MHITLNLTSSLNISEWEIEKLQGLRGTSIDPIFPRGDNDLIISIEPKVIIIGYRRDYRYLQFRGFDGDVYHYESNTYKWLEEKYFASGNSKIYFKLLLLILIISIIDKIIYFIKNQCVWKLKENNFFLKNLLRKKIENSTAISQSFLWNGEHNFGKFN